MLKHLKILKCSDGIGFGIVAVVSMAQEFVIFNLKI